MKNFIVPVDFSEDSVRGLDIAVMFSHVRHVNIQLVYVQEMADSASVASKKSKDEYQWAEVNLERLVKEYTPKLGHESSIRYIIKRGKIYQEIVSQVHSYKDSMIATSTHGASGFEELFIGSNTFKIIVASEKPVITTRLGDVPEKLNKIVLPLIATKQTRQKVPYTAELARLFDAEIHILSLSYNAEKRKLKQLASYDKQVKEYLDKVGVKHVSEKMIGHNFVSQAKCYAEDINADMVAIISERHSGINLVSGSWGHQVINNFDRLVLNLPPRKFGSSGSFSTTGG